MVIELELHQNSKAITPETKGDNTSTSRHCYSKKAIRLTLGVIPTHFDKAKCNSYVVASHIIENKCRHNSRTDILLQYRRQADGYPDIGLDRNIVVSE